MTTVQSIPWMPPRNLVNGEKSSMWPYRKLISYLAYEELTSPTSWVHFTPDPHDPFHLFWRRWDSLFFCLRSLSHSCCIMLFNDLECKCRFEDYISQHFATIQQKWTLNDTFRLYTMEAANGISVPLAASNWLMWFILITILLNCLLLLLLLLTEKNYPYRLLLYHMHPPSICWWN